MSTALIVVTLNLNAGTRYLMAHEFERSAHDDATVALKRAVATIETELLGVRANAAFSERQLNIPGELIVGSARKRTVLTGLESPVLYTPLAASGRPIHIPARGVVIATQFARLLSLRVGDVVQVRVLQGARRTATTHVAAIADSYLGARVFLNQRYLARLLGERDIANTVLVRTADGAVKPQRLAAVRAIRDVQGVSQRRAALAKFEQSFGGLMTSVSIVLVGIVGLVAFGAVLNSQIVALGERRREIGTLRVLGFEPVRVTIIFATEALLVSAPGVLAGLSWARCYPMCCPHCIPQKCCASPGFVAPEMLSVAAALMLANILFAIGFTHRSVVRLDWREVLSAKE